MKYILYGAAQYMRDHIDEEKIGHFEYIVDKDPNKVGTTYLGKEVKAPEVLLTEDKDDIFIVIAAFAQLYSIEFDLKAMGFEKEKHFDWLGRLRNHYPEHALWVHPSSEFWQQDEAAWREKYPNGTVHERAELVAKMIDWTDIHSVLDLGAGSEPMRPLLPEGVEYYPVDYKQLTGNTLIYDFNLKQFPSLKSDVVILVGVNGYVNYLPWLVDRAIDATNVGGQFIVSLDYFSGYYSVLDCITKHADTIKCIDYAFRDDHCGIFRFRKIG